jgi:hypothetical protein
MCHRPTAAAILGLALLPACGGTGSTPSPSPTAAPRASSPTGTPTPDPIDAWVHTDFPAADGFELPGPDTAVRSVAHGRVAYAGDAGAPWGHVATVDHVFYENHERRQIRSVYRHLARTQVRPGDVVKRGAVVGAVSRPDALDFELRWDASLPPTFARSVGHDAEWIRQRYAEPSTFVAGRRRLAVPQDEPALLVVSTVLRRMRVWLGGERVGDFEVAFGQGEGRKRRQHDLRTPLGMYFVVGKSRGPFQGPYADYYGGHWIKVNYPNAYDAAWGGEQRLMGADAARAMADAWWKREPTWQGSPLGGGIGFHGWAGDWDLDGPRRLSWGCVVMRNADIARLFPRIPPGAMVVIL